MSQLLFDLRLAGRSILRRPAAALVMVATLSMALGANAAIFGILQALVFHPFDFPAADRLVAVSETSDQMEFPPNLTPATFLDLERQGAEVVESMVGFHRWDANIEGRETPLKVDGARVSPEFFTALGVESAHGRLFRRGEDGSAGEVPVVIGHALWQGAFGGDAGVLGTALEIDGSSYTVIGVAPPALHFPTGSELWAPLTFSPEDAVRRDQHYVGAFGRLRDGVTLADAAARFDHLGEQLAERFPETNRGRGLATKSFAIGFQDPGLGPILGLWQGAAAVVLLIAWANLTNLMLVRSSERQRELAVLDALGAGRRRLIRLQLTEGALIATAASLLSLPFAWISLRLVRDEMPVAIRRYVAGWDSLGIDLGTLAFTAALAALSVAAISTWPAWRVSSARLASSLRAATLRGTVAGAGARGRALLLVGEITAALLIVVLATLSLRGATRLIDGPQGFDVEGQLVLKVALDRARYEAPAARRAFVRSALDRLAALPGVDRVAAANALPATSDGWTEQVEIEGAPPADPAQLPEADARWVTSGYFAALGIPLLAGRGFTDRDDAEAPPVAIVSRSMAERYWPGRDPVGARFRLAGEDGPWRTVVGVAGDHIHQWFARRDFPTFFEPYDQVATFRVAFAVHTAGDPQALADPVRRAFAAVDAAQPVYDLQPLSHSHYAATIGLRYVAGVLSVFAALALVLAVSGVYTVLACRVSLGMREACVRIALGASHRDVLGATLGHTLGLAGLGIALGLGAGSLAGRWLSAVLRGSVAVDAGVLLVAVGLLLTAALAAGIVPLRRVLAADPAAILKE